MAYDYEGRGQDIQVKGTTYRIPKDEDIADAPKAFEDYTNSIPFSEYVEVVNVDTNTTVDDSFNGKMIVATSPIELTLNNDLPDGFTLAAVAESNATIAYFGVDKENLSTEEYEVATVVTVNGTNILSVPGVSSGGCPECPECPDTPSAAVISGATADDPLFPVNTFSFTEDGQAYDVYEYLGSGRLVVDEPGMVEALIVGGGGAGGKSQGGGGGAGGHFYATDLFIPGGSQIVKVGGGGARNTAYSSLSGTPSGLGLYFGLMGGGGVGDAQTGANGGSGGGNSGIGLETQGHNGGDASSGGTGIGRAGGGGGAKSNGASGSVSGNGGDGLSNSITGDPVVRAAGGGGGSFNGTPGVGGSGIGGNGTSDNTAATDGAENTGSGGGGGGYPGSGAGGNGGAGGSGIVIVKVKVASPSFGPKTRSAVRTAHAARVENGVVREVIVIPHLDDDDTKITEYCNRIGLPGTWVDTSYTGSRRGKYAGVGDSFDVKARSGGGEFVSPPAPATAVEQDTMIIDDKEQSVKRRRSK